MQQEPIKKSIEQFEYYNSYVTGIDAPDYEQHYLEGELGETKFRVNLRTGRVDFNKIVKRLSGNKAPIYLRMVYNPYTQESSTFTGKWKLNIEQKIVYHDANTLYYIDAEFRVHTFKKLETSLYYDTDHTGMLIRERNGNYVLTDDYSVEMLFDGNNRLTKIRKYGKPNAVYVEISYGNNNAFTVTDGMGRIVGASAPTAASFISTIATSALTYSNGNLAQIADSKGETVNYTYDSATGLLTSISVNGESVTFVYDTNQRVESILYKVGDNVIKKQFFAYVDSMTEVKEAKYSEAENEAYSIVCYKFNDEGKLVAAFEKATTGESGKIVAAKCYSTNNYEKYTIDLQPENSICGQFHSENESGTFIGRFNDLPTLNEGERYVMFAMFNHEELFSNVENGHLDIYLGDGSNNLLPVMSIDETLDGSLPFKWVELPSDLAMNGDTLFFSVGGNCNVSQAFLSNIYICKTFVSTQKECITALGSNIVGGTHAEYKSDATTTWTEIEGCVLTGVTDCNRVTRADWRLTKRNMATANGSSFVVWYNDLEKAIYTNQVPTLTVNENVNYSMSMLDWATLQMQNIVCTYEYATYHTDGSIVVTQNQNTAPSPCTSYIDYFGRTYLTVNSENLFTEKTYDDYDRVLSTEAYTRVDNLEGCRMKTSMQYFDTPYEENGTLFYKEKYTDTEGMVTTYVYDYHTGDLISVTDPKGYTQKYTYDVKRRPTKLEQSTSENVLSYNTNDLLSALAHNTGAYAFTYDGYRQMNGVQYNTATLFTKTHVLTNDKDTETTSYANGGEMTCEYDKYGNLLSVTDEQYDEKVQSFVYGSTKENFENSELTERASENSVEVVRKKIHQNIDNPYEAVYNYDSFNRLKRIERSDGVIIDYDYDTQNRLTGESTFDEKGVNYSYQYTEGDAQTKPKLYNIGVTVDGVEMNTYNNIDAFNRLEGKNTEIYETSGWNTYITYNYQYEENEVDGKSYTNRRVTCFTSEVIRNNQEQDREECYGDTQELSYDENGNIQTISNSMGINTYSYDDRNRLVEEVDSARNIKYVYEYNDGGNITCKKEYSSLTGNLIHSYTYGYYNDRLTSYNGSPISYDACGNPVSYKWNTLLWTRGRLLSRYGNTFFGYDGEGFRRRKTRGNDTVTYCYENGKLISEKHTDPSKNLYFIYHGEEIIGFLKGETGVYYYQKDVLGNVVAVYDVVNGLVASYAYDAWGNCRIIQNVDGIATLNPIRYRGYYYDEETELYYLQTRYYDPETGRFISPDTVDYLDPETVHGLNLYAYCNNNPVMYTDPTGHFAWLILAAVLLSTPVGGTALQLAASVLGYAGMAGASIFDEDVRNDMNAIGWNPFNTNELATLKSNKVSFYKGVPVFMTSNSGRSGSFGAIFLTKGSKADTLRHERGHNWQLMMMGIGVYGFTVGIPSPAKLGKWDKQENYYGAPWETMADILGGVEGRTHSSAEKWNAWGYYAVTNLCFPLTAIYWL